MKRSKNVLWIVLMMTGILGAGTPAAHAIVSSPAIKFDTYTVGSVNNTNVVYGWDFTNANNVIVTHLGYYDYNADGLNFSHAVGIYYGPGWGALTGTLVPGGFATVAAGTVETNIAGSTYLGGLYSTFRYHDISDIDLFPGVYRIAGVDGDTTQDSPANLIVAPGISLGHAWEETSSGVLVYPDQFDTGGPANPWSGPNFLFGVPEPSTAMLFAAGGSWLLLRLRRR